MARQYKHYWIYIITEGVVISSSDGLPFLFTESQANRMINVLINHNIIIDEKLSSNQYTLSEIELIPINRTVKKYLKDTYNLSNYDELINYTYPMIKAAKYLSEFRYLMEVVSNYCASSMLSTHQHKYAVKNYVYLLNNYEELVQNA